VSAFHKTIDDPIVDVINVADPSLIQYINGNSGVLTGAEVEAELRNIGPFTLRGNVTYIDATLTYPVSNAGVVTDTVVGFPFQPEWIANLNLGYENEDFGIKASLIYNYTGEYATVLRSLNTGSDIIQNAQHAVDLVVSKSFGESADEGFELKFGVKNLWATDKEWNYAGGKESVDGRLFETTQSDRLYFLEGKYAF
jgi:outer membrane receptor for ferrienterochelin and colicin